MEIRNGKVFWLLKMWWRAIQNAEREIVCACLLIIQHRHNYIATNEWMNEWTHKQNLRKRNNRFEQIHENSNNQKFINHLLETNLLIRWICRLNIYVCSTWDWWLNVPNHKRMSEWIAFMVVRLTHRANVYARKHTFEMIGGKYSGDESVYTCYIMCVCKSKTKPNQIRKREEKKNSNTNKQRRIRSSWHQALSIKRKWKW